MKFTEKLEESGVFEPFMKMIKSYRIIDEDCSDDLYSFLWEIMSKYPDREEAYYKVALKREFFRLLKIKRENRFIQPIETDFVDNSQNFITKIIVKDLLKKLPNKQKEILIFRYIYGLSDVEIADSKKVSRQAVFKIRKRALNNLLLDFEL